MIEGHYERMQPNDRGHYLIAPMGVELGIREDGSIPWLRWWDAAGNLLLTGDERAIASEQARLQAEIAQQQAEQARLQAEIAQQQAEQGQFQAEQKAQRLAERLRTLGIDPEEI